METYHRKNKNDGKIEQMQQNRLCNAKFGGICQQFKLNKFVTSPGANSTAQCQTGTGGFKVLYL